MPRTTRTDRPGAIRFRAIAVACLACCIAVLPSSAEVQGNSRFGGRLSAVPIDFVSVLTTQGAGTFTATLEGNTLSIEGTFEGMNSPATVAHVRRAFKGLRGPSVFALAVANDTQGEFEGQLTLTAADIQDLRGDRLYVQIHSAVNPEGHLRGWILDSAEGAHE